MSIHEHLPPQARKDLKEVGWTKGLELAKVARRDGQEFDCATWLHKARYLPKDEFKREVARERFSVAQIVAVLEQAKVGAPDCGADPPSGDFTEQTLYRWKKQYKGLETDQVIQFRRLRKRTHG